jgi:hypothetical protein
MRRRHASAANHTFIDNPRKYVLADRGVVAARQRLDSDVVLELHLVGRDLDRPPPIGEERPGLDHPLEAAVVERLRQGLGHRLEDDQDLRGGVEAELVLRRLQAEQQVELEDLAEQRPCSFADAYAPGPDRLDVAPRVRLDQGLHHLRVDRLLVVQHLLRGQEGFHVDRQPDVLVLLARELLEMRDQAAVVGQAPGQRDPGFGPVAHGGPLDVLAVAPHHLAREAALLEEPHGGPQAPRDRINRRGSRCLGSRHR